MALNLQPNEEAVEIRPVGIRYRCEFCHEGFMEATGETELVEVLMTNPPQYNRPPLRTHKCTKCGKTMQLPSTYPRIDWEVVENET